MENIVSVSVLCVIKQGRRGRDDKGGNCLL